MLFSTGKNQKIKKNPIFIFSSCSFVLGTEYWNHWVFREHCQQNWSNSLTSVSCKCSPFPMRNDYQIFEEGSSQKMEQINSLECVFIFNLCYFNLVTFLGTAFLVISLQYGVPCSLWTCKICSPVLLFCICCWKFMYVSVFSTDVQVYGFYYRSLYGNRISGIIPKELGNISTLVNL